ncbi:MAG: hypothetical protein AB7K71_37485 [Polyangiaceae bacterium]
MDELNFRALEELRQQHEARAAARATSDESQSEEAPPESAKAPKAQPAAATQEPAIDWSTEPVPAYSNGLQLASSPEGFALVFLEHTRFPGRLAPGNQAGQERARIAASLRVNPELFFQMLSLMASNWNQFVNEYVDPRMRQPKFKLLDAGDAQLQGLSEKQKGDA